MNFKLSTLSLSLLAVLPAGLARCTEPTYLPVDESQAVSSIATRLPWGEDFEVAKGMADADGKMILVVITGADCTSHVSEDPVIVSLEQVVELRPALRETLDRSFVLQRWAAGPPAKLFAQRSESLELSSRRVIMGFCNSRGQMLNLVIGLPTKEEFTEAVRTATLADLSFRIEKDSDVRESDLMQQRREQIEALPRYWRPVASSLAGQLSGDAAPAEDSDAWLFRAEQVVSEFESHYRNDMEQRLGVKPQLKAKDPARERRRSMLSLLNQVRVRQAAVPVVAEPEAPKKSSALQRLAFQTLSLHAASRQQMCKAMLAVTSRGPFDRLGPVFVHRVWMQNAWYPPSDRSAMIDAISARFQAGKPVLLEIDDERLRSAVPTPSSKRDLNVREDLRQAIDALEPLSVTMTDLGSIVRTLDWPAMDISVPSPARMILVEEHDSIIDIIRVGEPESKIEADLRRVASKMKSRRKAVNDRAAVRVGFP